MNAIVIHDKAIIPARAENLLAVRWKRLAIKEGHAPAVPEMERRQQLNKQASISRLKHVRDRNDAAKRKADNRLLQHMAKPIGVADLAEKTGISKSQVRFRLARMKEEGRAIDFGGDGGFAKKLWQAVKGAKHVPARQSHINTTKSLETRAKVIEALQNGHKTSREIAQAQGISTEAARKALQRLAIGGEVVQVGEVQVGCGKAKIWQLAPCASPA